MMVKMYRKMYTTFFSAVTEALELMTRAQYIDAEAVLKKGQLETERLFILWEEQGEAVTAPGSEESPLPGDGR